MTMLIKTLNIFFVLYNVLHIEGSPGFRSDYFFSERADGWLKIHLIPATWSDAKILCHAEGAVLASPATHHLRDAILELVAKTSSVQTIFTGVHTTYSKGVYASIEGVPLTKMPVNWTPRQPDNFQNSESCITMLITSSKYGTISDENCNHVFSYVCYKKKTDEHFDTDCGTVDKEYRLDNRTGKCYKFHRHGLIWSRAYMTCMAEGGHLAIPNDETEFNYLKDLFSKNLGNTIFSPHTEYASIGLSDPNDGGNWVTIHGQTLKELGFERWQSGEPNNASQPEGELCGVMFRDNGNYFDAPCSWPLAFMCELKPERIEHNHHKLAFQKPTLTVETVGTKLDIPEE